MVAEDITHRVHVIDTETMRPRHTFPVKYPGPVAFDRAGRLWIIFRPERSQGRTDNAQELGKYRIAEYTLEGKPTGRQLTDLLVPSYLASAARPGTCTLPTSTPAGSMCEFSTYRVRRRGTSALWASRGACMPGLSQDAWALTASMCSRAPV